MSAFGHIVQSQAAAAGKAVSPVGIQVPYSAGRGVPQIAMPRDACDCHHHIYDPVNFAYVPEDVRNQPPATVDAYQLLQKRLGVTRSVIVQPSAYGTNNACTLAALEKIGSAARAVVVIDQSVSDVELQSMRDLGVRGIRFNIAAGASRDAENILALSRRVHELGWHVQFWMSALDTVHMESVLAQIPNQIVFDHRGHLPQPEGVDHPAFQVICKLLNQGKAWMKLSGLYLDSKVSGPTYTDTVKVGRAFVQTAPERMLWGTDWPHPSVFSERMPWPDDASMLSLLAEQAPDEAVRHRILVQNPEALYGFQSTSAGTS